MFTSGLITEDDLSTAIHNLTEGVEASDVEFEDGKFYAIGKNKDGTTRWVRHANMLTGPIGNRESVPGISMGRLGKDKNGGPHFYPKSWIRLSDLAPMTKIASQIRKDLE